MPARRLPAVLRASLLAVLMAMLAACQAPAGPDGAVAAATPEPSSQPLPDSADESEPRRRARIRTELAAGYYQQRNLPVALDEARQAIAADPTYAPALGLLGLLYMDLNERARAEEAFQRALRLTPNDSELNVNYGWFLCQTGRERASLDHFNRAVRNPLYTSPSKAMHNAGVCLRRINDEAAAEGYFQRAFQLDPRNPVAMYNLADIYLKRGEYDRSRFYIKRILAGYEPSAEILWLALRVERAAGNRDAEASYAVQLRRRFPSSPETSLLSSGQYGQ